MTIQSSRPGSTAIVIAGRYAQAGKVQQAFPPDRVAWWVVRETMETSHEKGIHPISRHNAIACLAKYNASFRASCSSFTGRYFHVLDMLQKDSFEIAESWMLKSGKRIIHELN